jgi:signal transduction histidine kinase
LEARTRGAGRASPYRGADRRAGLGLEVGRGPALTGGIILLGLWLALLIAGLAEVRPARLDVALLDAFLDTVAVTVVVLAGVAILLRWRLSGEAPHFYIGVAVLVYGVVTVAGATLTPLLFGVSPAWSDALRVGGRVAALGLLFYAVQAPAVDSALRPGRVLAITAAATAAFTVVLLVVPGATEVFLGATEAPPEVTGLLIGSLVLMVVWSVLAVLCIRAGARRQQVLLTWLGLGVAGLALVELSRVLLGPDATIPAVSALRSAAFLAILVGAAPDLQTFFATQRGTLLRSALTALSAEARHRADEAAGRRFAHDALNALTAIQGANQTLERFQDRLEPGERAALASALQTEIGRLQEMVTSAARAPEGGTYAVATHIAPVVADVRAAGALVDVTIPPDLQAHGQWADTAEAVRVVLQALRAHAPARRLAVGSDDSGDVVRLRVEHNGDSTPASEAPQRPVEELPGGQLDLHVAADLIRRQGGDLLVEQHPDRLAFVFVLPVGQG